MRQRIRLTLAVVAMLAVAGCAARRGSERNGGAAASAVQTVAIEIGGVVHEKITDSIDHAAVVDRGKAEPAADGNRKAGHHDRNNLCAAIARQHHRDVVALRDESLGQGLDDVRQAAGLGKRQAFRSYEEDSHSFVIWGSGNSFTLSNPWERVKHGAL